MSKKQEMMVKYGGTVAGLLLVGAVTWGVVKTEMSATMSAVADHETRIDKVEIHMERQTTNQEWIMDSLKRLEGRKK